jgi:hypothetical protein
MPTVEWLYLLFTIIFDRNQDTYRDLRIIYSLFEQIGKSGFAVNNYAVSI